MWHVWEERAYCQRLSEVEKLTGHARIHEWVPKLTDDPLPPRRRVLTPIQLQQAAAQAEAWLKLGVVEIIKTPPVTNNLVLVAKKDGRIRVCVDCTPANRVTEDFDWPLPRLQDIRYRIKGATWFARIDLRDAFFRIEVPAEYRHLTAFMVGTSTFQFKRMPFGLKTAPATFQRFMDWGLSEFWAWAVWYIDDILITGTSRSEVIDRERIVRERLRQMKCAVNEEKSVGARTEVLFTGLCLSGAGIGPNHEQVKLLLTLRIPTTKAEMQSALGLVSYLRDFIPLVTHFTAQLYPDKNGLRLPQDEIDDQWVALRKHLVSALTINHHWRDGVHTDVFTDASLYALGVVIIQDQRIVALASRKLTPAETRYSATDREHLGLVWAAEKFKLLLHQKGLVRVWSDHSALLTRKTERLTPRQARWQATVNAWIPNLSHVRGKSNPADYVSRWKGASVGANFRT